MAQNRVPTRSTHDSGLSRLGILILLLLVGAVVYAGSQVFPYFYNFYELQGLMEAQADKASEFSDDEIRKTILNKIKKLDLPNEPELLKINRFDGKIVIEYEYSEMLYFDLDEDHQYDLHRFDFHPRAERQVSRKRDS